MLLVLSNWYRLAHNGLYAVNVELQWLAVTSSIGGVSRFACCIGMTFLINHVTVLSFHGELTWGLLLYAMVVMGLA